jgi:hypothetical protein
MEIHVNRTIVLILSVCVLFVRAPAAAGQSSWPLQAGLSLGTFASFPEPFLPEYCEQGAIAAIGSVSHSLSSHLSLEGQGVVSGGGGGMVCAIPGLPAPPPGSTFDRRTFGDQIEGMSFLTTIVSLGGELRPEASSSLRGRIGLGRLWGKGLGMWSLGAGYRRGLGAGQLTLDVERWSFDIPFVRESILVGDEGEWLVQESEESEQGEHPFLIRIGYELRIR